METKLLFVHALSPLHAGTGQGVETIDLPIAREKATGIPFLPGSTLKGVYRDACGNEALRIRVFGPDTGNAELHAGAVTFTDARLLLLPVRSLRGVFAWATSPLLLRRLTRDAQGYRGIPGIPVPADEESCLTANENGSLTMEVNDADKVILEDLPLTPAFHDDAKKWAEWIGKKTFPQDDEAQEDLLARFCVISDDALSFLLETATEIAARIQIDDDKKTAKEHMLWYEEALPTETVLVSQVVASTIKIKDGKITKPDEVFKTVKKLSEKTLQFGGKATVGRGLCQATLA
ncbi:MAG: type III-B CRISPR module RAMP protein Cmr4 [Chloroflexota bacterium]